MLGKSKSFRNQRIPGYKKPMFNFLQTSSDGWKVWAWVILIVVGIPFVAVGSWFYVKIIKQLPDISEIENFDFKQATIITDRDGEELYKLFEENRDYVGFDGISEHFVNAIVATEDQRFWTNPGIDWKGTLRAGITDVTQGKTHGGSTITQQLIKNIMLTPEKKLERKLKEIILAMKLNKYVKKDTKRMYNNLSSDELDRRVKEKILELYSNYIFLGNNSYGVETASYTYFATGAKNLDILEASILAGIPQAPSRYDPYTNRAILMGALVVEDESGTPVDLGTGLRQEVLTRINKSINETNFTFKRDDSAIIDFFKGLLDFTITYENQIYKVNYNPGRKDTVLARMYEEGYITEAEFKRNFIRGLDFKFQRGAIEIKAPHFVFWVIRELEKNYDPEVLRKGGLTVTTTLDYQMQKMAEQSIEEQGEHLDTYQAGNAAMLYMDTENGDVLAYVGSRNYYDEDIDGQVDIIQSKRQPGSTIKPLVYALGFTKLALTLDSPIYDVEMRVGGNTPQNADGQFNGLMALKNALAHSRNIPAIKMFFSVGGEAPLKDFLSALGVNSLIMEEDHYGYPLAIGAAEMPMLELAQAYSHLSAMGRPAKVNPILEVRSADGALLYKKVVAYEEQVIPTGVAYLIWEILSNKANFPEAWIGTFSYPSIKFGTKSGTTNVVSKNNQKLPRDGWLMTYTPTKVAAFWAGNTDGSPLRQDAYGGWLNSPVWKGFIRKLEDNELLTNQSPSQVDVKSVSISKISGKLSTFETPLAFTTKSLGYTKTIPGETDENVVKIEVDKLCNGEVSPLTPRNDIQTAYYITPTSIMPDQRDLPEITEWWETEGMEKLTEELGTFVTISAITGECAERDVIAELGEITLNLIQPEDGQDITRNFTVWHQSKSPFKITSVKLFLDDIELKSFRYNKQGNLVDISAVAIPEMIEPGEYTLKAIVLDEKGYSDSKSVKVNLVGQDTNPPVLLEDKTKVEKKDDDRYDVVLLFQDDASVIRTGRIERNGELVHEFDGNLAIFTVKELGNYTYSVVDDAGNKGGGQVELK